MQDFTIAYPVMELFYTLQGEGVFSGTPSIFLRLGGCSVGCVWCDVKESWDKEAHPKMTIQEIADSLKNFQCNRIVITGGEPLEYNLFPLTTYLKENGYLIHLETSGSFPFSGVFDWVCLSPKKFKLPLDEVYPLANELKVIIFNKSDFKFAEEHALKVSPSCQLFLQVEWNKSDTLLTSVIDYVKANPTWRISLQTHKYLDIP